MWLEVVLMAATMSASSLSEVSGSARPAPGGSAALMVTPGVKEHSGGSTVPGGGAGDSCLLDTNLDYFFFLLLGSK